MGDGSVAQLPLAATPKTFQELLFFRDDVYSSTGCPWKPEASDLLELELQMSMNCLTCGCWELDSGPLEEQEILATETFGLNGIVDLI